MVVMRRRNIVIVTYGPKVALCYNAEMDPVSERDLPVQHLVFPITCVITVETWIQAYVRVSVIYSSLLGKILSGNRVKTVKNVFQSSGSVMEFYIV